MRILLYLFLFITYNCLSQTGNAFFKHFDTDDGLSDDHITAILKDKTGFLWVGTANGLNRFDGYNFKNYLPDIKKSKYTVSNEYICDIVQDKNEIIWIGTNDGLNRYDPRTQQFKVYKYIDNDKTSLPNSLVRDLYLDTNDRLWVICDNRDPVVFESKTETFRSIPWQQHLLKKIPSSSTQSYKAIYSIEHKSESEFYLVTKFGLWSYDLRSEKFKNYKLNGILKTFGSGALYFTLKDDPSHFYGIMDDNLYISDTKLKNKQFRVNTIINYANEHWLLTNQGISVLNSSGNIKQLSSSASQVPNGSLSSYYRENSGTLWLGGETGLYLYEPEFQRFHYQSLHSSIKYSKFIYSRLDGFLYALNEQKNEIHLFDKSKLIKIINLPGKTDLLKEDNKGNIWTGGGDKLFNLKRNTFQLIEFNISHNFISSAGDMMFTDMAEDSDGRLWFANDYNGLIVYNPRSRSWWHPDKKDEFISTNVSVLVADHSKKTIWIGTNEYGLYRYDEKDKQFNLYRPSKDEPQHSLGAYVITSLCKDSTGNIWISTDHGGISKFSYRNKQEQAFTTYGMEHGLPSNQVYGLVCDPIGAVWAGTAKGLVRINTLNNKISYYSKHEGISKELIDQPFSLTDEMKIIYPFKNGYKYFDPLKFTKTSSIHDLHFSSFKIFDKGYIDSLSVNYKKEINLYYEQNFFTFEVFSNDLSNVNKNQFYYQLLNYDKQWMNLKGGQSVSYSHVPPGKYTLQVRGIRDGEWNSIPLQINITIYPPFWLTWWFKTLIGLFIAGVIYFIYYSHIQKIRKEETLKTEFNKKIAQTEMAALRAQMNPHFVFNCLSSINHFILANRADDASAYLTKFSRLIRLILDNSRSETNVLKKELETLQLYIEMEAMRFSNKFSSEIIVDKQINTEEIMIPPMLIQPYVENAIWHGLMHKKEKGRLLIRLEMKTDQLVITIEDNGIGRDEANTLKSKSASINKSHGTQMTSERIFLMNQIYNSRANVIIDDISDEKGIAAGTRVTITIQQQHIKL